MIDFITYSFLNLKNELSTGIEAVVSQNFNTSSVLDICLPNNFSIEFTVKFLKKKLFEKKPITKFFDRCKKLAEEKSLRIKYCIYPFWVK